MDFTMAICGGSVVKRSLNINPCNIHDLCLWTMYVPVPESGCVVPIESLCVCIHLFHMRLFIDCDDGDS